MREKGLMQEESVGLWVGGTMWRQISPYRGHDSSSSCFYPEDASGQNTSLTSAVHRHLQAWPSHGRENVRKQLIHPGCVFYKCHD